MRYELSQRFFFDAAHSLKRSIDTVGSARVHGHTYSAEVAVVGTPDEATGMVVDLGILRQAVESVRLRLDHQLLDEIGGLDAPTLERLCLFVHSSLKDLGIHASRVSVWREGIGDRCELRTD